MVARQVCDASPNTALCLGQLAALDTTSGAQPVVVSQPATQPSAEALQQFTPQQIEFMRAVDAAQKQPFLRVMQINTTMAPSDAALARLRHCESRGNYGIVSKTGTYHGAYQFDQRTWNGVMGGAAGLPGFVGVPPEQAPAGVQDAGARVLYTAAGPGKWPRCGRLIALAA
jgi:hypothetical protein